MSKIIDVTISTQLNDILNSEEVFPNLPSDVINEIRNIAQNKMGQPVDQKTRIKALIALHKYGPKNQNFDILSKILSNRSEDRYVRIACVKPLLHFSPSETENVFLQNLADSDKAVLSRLLRSLGRMGSLEALDALGEVEDHDDPRMARHLKFAKALVSFRNGISSELPENSSQYQKQVPDKVKTFLSIEKIDSAEVAKHTPNNPASIYSIDVCMDYGFKFVCGRCNFLVLLDKVFSPPISITDFVQRPRIAGLVLTHCIKNYPYATSNIILTYPDDKNGIQLRIYRKDGELVYAGEGTKKEDTILWTIMGLNKKRSIPISFTGKIDDTGLMFEECITSYEPKATLKDDFDL